MATEHLPPWNVLFQPHSYNGSVLDCPWYAFTQHRTEKNIYTMGFSVHFAVSKLDVCITSWEKLRVALGAARRRRRRRKEKKKKRRRSSITKGQYAALELIALPRHQCRLLLVRCCLPGSWNSCCNGTQQCMEDWISCTGIVDWHNPWNTHS